MKKIYIFENYRKLWDEYKRFSKNLKHKMKSGSFWRLSFEKRNSLLKKLASLRNRLTALNPAVKPIAAAAILAFSLNMPAANAQSFVEETVNNPLSSIDIGDYPDPAFADLDNDGDQDLILGAYYGPGLKYYKNTGSASSPVFTEQTGVNNPFASITGSNYYAYFAPTFADLDNDGDFDMMLGEDMHYDNVTYETTNRIRYFKNTGSATVPAFTEQTGSNNPFPVIQPGDLPDMDELDPVLVDIDNDGDEDLFVGEEDGPNIFYYKNTGTGTVPAFTLQTGTNNPFNTLAAEIDNRARIAFADLDVDGDFDMVVGYSQYISYYDYDDKIGYYKNTGTASAPVFTWTTGSANPFDGITLDYSGNSFAFVDMDNDADKDLIIADTDGGMRYIKNTSVLGNRSVVDISLNLTIVPNPAGSAATLSFSSHIHGDCEITIKNLQGMVLSTETVSKNSFELKHALNIDNLTPGMYMIELKNENNAGVVKMIKR